MIKGLKQEVKAEFYTASTRPPVGLSRQSLPGRGRARVRGQLAGDEPIVLYRFANRVPLLYQQGACAVTKGVISTAWRSYGAAVEGVACRSGRSCSWCTSPRCGCPSRSESKEAIAHYPEIMKEIRLAIQECGRRLSLHIRRGLREKEADRKRSYIEKYIPHIGIALKEILALSDAEELRVVTTLRDTLERSRKMD